MHQKAVVIFTTSLHIQGYFLNEREKNLQNMHTWVDQVENNVTIGSTNRQIQLL